LIVKLLSEGKWNYQIFKVEYDDVVAKGVQKYEAYHELLYPNNYRLQVIVARKIKIGPMIAYCANNLPPLVEESPCI
jgi:hypothetical protein